ncbi:MAG: phosphoglycerate mutase family protein [Pseudomonadales bacterium]|nr:phosphoglycerate mutase family protein [Pseudomonadales bacterium]MDP6471928.1 phosphoglycerate mutase family protein [Pseudomonadales bacterium]MDP6826802.1 phosphoglycerate mutase family protein [Pseudomonadales bacterium]MDP6970920.1 phosphoglycerate mutase family protein [Pseudomonadales bacterium]
MSTYGDETLRLIRRVFDGGAEHAAVLMRHSAREFARDVHDLDNPLTEEGRRLSERLGTALPQHLTVRAYASPAQRCMETAEIILEAHRSRGGRATRHRPVEALGVFYVLDQMKMWKGMRRAGGMTQYLESWFRGEVPDDTMMPSELAARLVLTVVIKKLSAPVARPQLDICVSHDLTVALVRDRLLGEPASGPDVEFLDVLIAFESEGRLWLQSHHGEARDVTDLARPL